MANTQVGNLMGIQVGTWRGMMEGMSYNQLDNLMGNLVGNLMDIQVDTWRGRVQDMACM